MQITIFGAAGLVGKRLCDQALAMGWRVIAFDRKIEQWLDKDAVTPNLEVKKGYLMDATGVAKAMEGSSAIFMVLTGNQESGDKSRIIGCKNIVAAMQDQKVQRLLVLGEYGVLPDEAGNYLFTGEDFPPELKERSEQYAHIWELLQQSPIRFTMVCAETIIDAPEGHAYIIANNRLPDSGIHSIAAGDLARFILRELGSDEHLNQRVAIRNV
jgi:putative NADH-flavin reductase